MLFYLFAIGVITFAICGVTLRNSVHCVLSLIMAFFNTAGIFLLSGAEFLAMMLIIVYVGAVAVLFLFVVMLLDIPQIKIRTSFASKVFSATLITSLAVEMTMLLYESQPIISHANLSGSNTKAIGKLLYTKYVYPFEIAGFLLLVALVGIVALTIYPGKKRRTQNIAQQLAQPSKPILHNPGIGEGIDVLK